MKYTFPPLWPIQLEIQLSDRYICINNRREHAHVTGDLSGVRQRFLPVCHRFSPVDFFRYGPS